MATLGILMFMVVVDLGMMAYREAWAAQEQAHAAVAEGQEERLLLVEHPPVITFGRRPNAAGHVLASDEQLARLGVEVVQSDRGGDVTFHGPGQLVAYPIIRLADHGLSIGGYVQRLEDGVIAALAEWGLVAEKDPKAIGVWVRRDGRMGKICALGVRIRRGVSLHGIALNVRTDLRYFELIVPCGLREREVCSMQQVLGERTPEMGVVKEVLARQLGRALGG